MGYKISGILSNPARPILLNESNRSIVSNTEDNSGICESDTLTTSG